MLQRDPVNLLLRGWRQCGEVFEIKVAGRRFVAFVGPEAHQAYFRAPDTVLSQKEVYRFTVPIFGRGVAYDASPDLMAEQIGFLIPAVRDSRMQTYADQMYAEVNAYVHTWRDEGEIDLAAVLNEMTVNIACRCLLGHEIRAQLYAGFDRLYHDLQGGINMVGFFAPHLPIPAHMRRNRARRAVGQLIGGILAERRRQGQDADDLMQTLMEARYRNGRQLTDEEITGILITALFAGQHTSGVLATWVGLELMQHPQCIAPIREEITAIYTQNQGVSTATMRRQKTLERAVREAERLHPPLIILVRKVLEDFSYKDFRIPAGIMAMVSPVVSHRLPTVFDDPERYHPDRFLGPDGNDRIEPHTLITFGGGKHVCIGAHFAYMQIKMIWSILLSRFDFDLTSPYPAPDYGAWVTGPKNRCVVRYKRRPAEERVL